MKVSDLLDRSRPAAVRGWLAYVAPVLFLMVLLIGLSGGQNPDRRVMAELAAGLGMLGIVAAMSIFSARMVRNYRREQNQLEAISELIQLRRWDDAAKSVYGFLSVPAQTPASRAQGLLFLTMILGRFHRFGDAMMVGEELCREGILDPATEHQVRVGRAMAMLHEDHLVDVDRAISELRKSQGENESGGLALVEIYRDVKTGHAQEAIELFIEKLGVIRQQLGIRVADAYVLAAKAYDMLGRNEEAQKAYENATTLAATVELNRRYPEVRVLEGKYTATQWPGGMS